MSKQKKKASEAQDAGGFDVKAQLLKMQENINDAHFLAKACRVLEEQLDAYPARLPAGDETKLITTVVNGLKKHPSDQPDFNLAACRLLCRLLFRQGQAVKGNQKCMIDTGGIEALERVMQENKYDGSVQESTLRVLKITCNDALVPRSAVEALSQAAFEALKRHKDNLAVSFEAVDVLSSIGGNMETDTADRAMCTVIGIMRSKKYSYIQLVACHALSEIANGHETRTEAENAAKIRALWQHGAFTTLLEAVDIVVRDDTDTNQKKKDPSDVCMESSSLLLIKAFDALSMMLVSIPTFTRLEDDPTVALRAMDKYMDCGPDLQGEASKFLVYLMETSKHLRGKMGLSGAKILMRAVTLYKDDEDVHTHAYLAIADAAASDQSAAAYLIEDACMRTHIERAQKWIRVSAVQLSIVSFFHFLACSSDLVGKQAMLQAGCVVAVVKAMRTHKDADTSHVQSTGSRALAAMCDVNLSYESYTSFVKAGAADVLFYAMDNCKGQDSTVMHGCIALKNILGQHSDNLAEAGRKALAVMIRATLMCPEDLKVQNAAAVVMCDIMQYALSSRDLAAYQNDFVTHAGIKAVNKCLDVYITGTHSSTVGPILHMTGMWVSHARMWITTVAIAVEKHAKNQSLFIKGGVSTRIIKLLCKPQSHDMHELVLDGCRALTALMGRDESHMGMLVKQGAVPIFARGVRVESDPGRRAVLQRFIDACAPGYNDSEAHLWSGQRPRDDDGSQRSNVQAGGAGAREKKNNDACVDKFSIDDASSGASGGQISSGGSISSGGKKDRVNEACSNCGKTCVDLGIERLLKCSGCTIAPVYCSVVCQQACWKAHKADCKANKKKSA
jgi:hypothetical protein